MLKIFDSYLVEVQLDKLLFRIRHNFNSRPLLLTTKPELRLKQLLEQRDSLYRERADHILPTGDQQIKK